MSSYKKMSKELRDAKQELSAIKEQLSTLRSRKTQLESKIELLSNQLESLNENAVDDNRFDGTHFEWSHKVQQLLEQVFRLKQFRSHQLAAINATLSDNDVLLVMPTGGGKSLVFQLPALLAEGLTVVVSPLISLMEDQLTTLRELKIPTAIINAQTSREDTTKILHSMVDNNSDLKIIYVTPEKLAKSKRFMAQMEKVYRGRGLARIVIDEVHCCSQWGHDFRQDYKFLGIMKSQFSETPILGLTATATATVISDIQKILNIEGCIVLKDSFYRPNLVYSIESINQELNKKEDLIEHISNLLKTKFKDQSGIIYCLTIKDVEEVSDKLKAFGIKAEGYHAQLDSVLRSKVHQNWYHDKCQVIVATIAFGMGINKLDVRFVIHYSMSKSLENYYQETGRAGRDGKPAECLLFYRFADVFRATSLVFSEKNGLANVYSMLAYCLNHSKCRKGQIAEYFGDEWLNDCETGCDNCLHKEKLNEKDVTKYLNDIIAILNNASQIQERMTPLKLMDSWFSKGNKKLRLDDVDVPDISRDVCEQIIGLLLIDGYLKEDFHFTPYSTISYLIPGPRAHTRSDGHKICYNLKNSFNETKRKKESKINNEIQNKKQKVVEKPKNKVPKSSSSKRDLVYID